MSGRPPRFSDRVEDAALGAALALARLLGPRLATKLGAGLGRLGYWPFQIRRRHVEANLRIAFPERDAAWIRRTAAASYAHLGRESVSTLLEERPGQEAGPPVHEGLDVLRRGLAAGHGVVLVGGHLGNWEVGAAFLAGNGFPVTAIVRRQRNPLFDRRISKVRRNAGLELIERGGAVREALKALGKNRVVLLIADQDARRAGEFVPFFGRPASTPRGPAVLAHRSGAPLAFMAMVRGPDGRLRLRIEPLDVALSGEPEAVIREITRAFVARLEEAVRATPEQYLWHHRRWKTQPPELAGAGPPPARRP